MSATIKVFTDGSSLTNPGPAGWAVVISPVDEVFISDSTKFFTGGFPVATNNIAELTAVLEALRWLNDNGHRGVTIYSDSKYAVDGSNSWVHNWIKTNWKGGTIKNIGIWKEIYHLYCLNGKPLEWIKGHSVCPFNNFADSLAGKAANAFKEQQIAKYNRVGLGDSVVTWIEGERQPIVTRFKLLQIYPTNRTIVLQNLNGGKNLIMSDKEFNLRKFILL